MPDDRQPGGSVKVEYTRGGVPKQCPGCGHRFHPAGQCEHEWREYGVDNPTEQRCLCDRNMAIRIPEPGGSGAGSTVVQCDWWPAPCQCSAALEAAQREIYETSVREREKWDEIVAYWKDQAEQSRATEAELRAKVERRDDAALRARNTIGHIMQVAEAVGRGEESVDPWWYAKRMRTALAALDAAAPTSQDASNRPLTDPSAHGSAKNDHSAMETTGNRPRP